MTAAAAHARRLITRAPRPALVAVTRAVEAGAVCRAVGGARVDRAILTSPVEIAVARATDAAAVPRAPRAPQDQRRRASVLRAAGALPARLARAHAPLAPPMLAALAACRLAARGARPARVALADATEARAMPVALVRAHLVLAALARPPRRTLARATDALPVAAAVVRARVGLAGWAAPPCLTRAREGRGGPRDRERSCGRGRRGRRLLGHGDALASSRADGHVSGPLAGRHRLLRTLHHSSLHHSSLHAQLLRCRLHAQLLRCRLRLAGRPLAVGSVEGGWALAEVTVP